jgi:pimeloyl-ACP methyl ester carboxylesterase
MEMFMATMVLVSGAWLGGWCWQRVRPLLREAGHEVYTPTLTGLGDRVHLVSPEVGLETHVLDVVNLLEFEDLHDVILLGHSYAGMVAGSVAHRVPERIAQVVYLAAAIPHDGEAMFHGWSDAGLAGIAAAGEAAGVPWGWPFPEDLETMGFGLSDADEAWMRAKCVPHPLKTMRDPAHFTNPGPLTIPRSFINCTGEGEDFPDEVQNSPSTDWRKYEIPTGHWPMITLPIETSEILHEIAVRG